MYMRTQGQWVLLSERLLSNRASRGQRLRFLRHRDSNAWKDIVDAVA